MCNEKIKIRTSDFTDCKEIFDWQNDELSRSMFFNESTPTFEEHKSWFENSLTNVGRTMYVGEVGAGKIGICRFDYIEPELLAEISINMNPQSRGRGLGEKFLTESVEYYLEKNKHDLLAKVKPTNLASLKVFKSSGFEVVFSNSNMISLKRSFKEISFKEVVEEDADVLFELLEKRTHSISHQTLPTKDEHLLFVKTSPYRHWAVVLEDGCPIGTFYIQPDNSIGLNLRQHTRLLVSKILRHIRVSFQPLKEIKSKVPSYFYVNVSYSNKELSEILLELDALPIQTSYKV